MSNESVTQIAIVLDRSGSMDEVRDETISGFNEQVETVVGRARDQGRVENTFVSLVLFSDTVEFVKFCEPVEALTKISREQYRPDRTTAMYDAVGATLGRFDKVVADGDHVRYLVVIISDGYENASTDYDAEKIAEMIRARQATGRWTFSYMGANQDLAEISRHLGIPRENMSRYESTSHGTVTSFQNLSRSMVSYMDQREAGKAGADGFFDDDEPDDDEARARRKSRLH